eukprot:NODE_654_length_1454_cov_268.333096_g493_i0.p1 GENE.NODE_654_length_1454_cov_268.333096_g493_i0~~NODE_654_length_1454_cov_268.333096_g493_i0.p1  ORF type:complete len:437 (+),score=105.09 NODE_654_length_1454_cov_268.333096_g493_i0:88-1398(+)
MAAAAEQRAAQLVAWLGPSLAPRLEALTLLGYDSVDVFRSFTNDSDVEALLDSVKMTSSEADQMRRAISDLTGLTTAPPEKGPESRPLTFVGGMVAMHIAVHWVGHTARRTAGRAQASRFSNAPNWSRHRRDGPQSRAQFLAFLWLKVFRNVKSTFDAIRVKDVFQTLTCLAFTLLVVYQKWRVSYSPTLFLDISIFPLSFAIQSAYVRREQALQHLAALKSAVASLLFLLKTWRDDKAELHAEVACQTLDLIRDFVSSSDEEEKELLLEDIQSCLQLLVDGVYNLCRKDVPPPLVVNGLSCLSAISTSFEYLRISADYRTPFAIRSFTRFCSLSTPLLLALYLANLIPAFDGHSWFHYYGIVALSLIYAFLRNIQQMLELPFAQEQDDINLDHLGCECLMAASTDFELSVAAPTRSQKIASLVASSMHPVVLASA